MKRVLVLAMIAVFVPCLLVAQGATPLPGNDKVTVTLPQQVTLENQVLEPGEYTIEEHLGTMNNESAVLHIYKDDKLLLKTSVLTAPAGSSDWVDETKLVLQKTGNGYRLDKLWIQGRKHGYQFTPPEGVGAESRQDSSGNQQSRE